MRRMFLVLMSLLCLAIVVRGEAVRLNDRRDWWSINNEGFRPPSIEAGTRNITVGTFQILGVTLSVNQFDKLAVQMGKAPVAERGDASTGRQQVCYMAAESAPKVYLIFEFGSAEQGTFYLFSGGQDWSGEKLCVRTKKVSRNLATPSGLRLGLKPLEVEAILGKADAVSTNKLVYAREIMEKTTPAQFEELRKDYPEPLSDQQSHQQFDFHSVDLYIEVHFGKSGMNYLAVSKTGVI